MLGEHSAVWPIDYDNYNDEELSPFDKISMRMTSVTADNKVRKLVQVAGSGKRPARKSIVFVYYSSYLEYKEQPVSSNEGREPYCFQLGKAFIRGLDVAVQSMAVGEKSLFLLHYEYAYGARGRGPKIPPEAVFIFQVHLLDAVDKSLRVYLQRDAVDFEEVHKKAAAMFASGNEYFKYNNMLAKKEYQKAIHLLEKCSLRNMCQEKRQQEMLVKLYTNLAVCHTKDREFLKVCNLASTVYAMCTGAKLDVPVRMYFHHGRALHALGNHEKAQEFLVLARNREPTNTTVDRELENVRAALYNLNIKNKTRQWIYPKRT